MTERSSFGHAPVPLFRYSCAIREIDGPMALVILGGLFTSTALNLLVMPSLALRYGGFDAERTGQKRSLSSRARHWRRRGKNSVA